MPTISGSNSILALFPRKGHVIMCPQADFSCATVPEKRGALLLAVKDVPLYIDGTDANECTAYFSVFNNIDRQGEIVSPGAYTNIDEFRKSGWIGFNHKMDDLPIGRPVAVVQDSRGLKVTFEWHGHDEAQAVREVVRSRIANGQSVFGSVGYRTIASEPVTVNGKSCKRLTKLWLAECSIVNLPANVLAEVISAKAGKDSLVNIDEAMAVISAAALETKSGRTHSAATVAKLTAVYSIISEMLLPPDESQQQPIPSAGDGEDPQNPAQEWRSDVAGGGPDGTGQSGPVRARGKSDRDSYLTRSQRIEQLAQIRAISRIIEAKFDACQAAELRSNVDLPVTVQKMEATVLMVKSRDRFLAGLRMKEAAESERRARGLGPRPGW
jgi:HK97 family phage prohead protease